MSRRSKLGLVVAMLVTIPTLSGGVINATSIPLAIQIGMVLSLACAWMLAFAWLVGLITEVRR